MGRYWCSSRSLGPQVRSLFHRSRVGDLLGQARFVARLCHREFCGNHPPPSRTVSELMSVMLEFTFGRVAMAYVSPVCCNALFLWSGHGRDSISWLHVLVFSKFKHRSLRPWHCSVPSVVCYNMLAWDVGKHLHVYSYTYISMYMRRLRLATLCKRCGAPFRVGVLAGRIFVFVSGEENIWFCMRFQGKPRTKKTVLWQSWFRACVL